MRFAVFVFSLVLVVMPAYVHAIVFVPAVTGALVRTAGGAVVKVANKKTLAGVAVSLGVPVAIDYCKKNKQKCKDWVGDVAETFFDDDNTDDGCHTYLIYQGARTSTKSTNLSAVVQAEVDNAMQRSKKDYGGLNLSYVSHEQDFSDIQEQSDRAVQRHLSQYRKTKSSGAVSVNSKQNLIDTSYVSSDGKTRHVKLSYSVSLTTYIACNDADNDRKLDELGLPSRHQKQEEKKQAAQKIIERIKDNDPDYIINNYGDQINIGQYCSAHACDELTAEFGDEVMKNKSKYDIDKINKANCEVENNKIKSCKNAKKDKDEQETEQTDEQQTEGQGDKGDQDPIECDASAFHKKVCDFIDWYQDDTDLDDDTKVKVTDLSDGLQLDKNRIKFTAQCPADKTFKMAYAGVEVSPSISYRSLCDAFIMMKPFIIGLSGIAAALIVTVGGRRG